MKIVARSIKGEWFTGELNLEKMKISKKKEINKLSEAKTEAFVTIKKFLSINKIDNTEDGVFKTLKVTSLYLLPEVKKEESEPNDEAALEKRWWKNFNKFCLGCKKECKQSSMVTIVKCPPYDKLPA